MGKAGRIACITIPMVLSIISLILLAVVCVGGWNKNDSNLSSLYYFQANTSSFKSNLTSSGVLSTDFPGDIDDKLRSFLSKLGSSGDNQNLSDVYQVYLWNYCSGDIVDGDVKLTYCSDRVARYWFDPISVWGLNGTSTEDLIPGDLQKGLDIYRNVSQWMFVAYAVAFFTTLANIVIGLLAICSRWGSCVTTIFSCAATLFSFLAALTSTILFTTLTGTFNSVLRTYGIKLAVGQKMFALDWIAFAFSLAATLFWTVSICCCSGKSDRRGGRGEKNTNAPYFAGRGYQPLGGAGNRGSYGNQPSNVEMGNMGGASPYKGRETAYEPFRHS